MGRGHEADGPSLRPLVLVLALFVGAVAAALGTAGPPGTHLQPEKAAPASHLGRASLLVNELPTRR